MDNIININNKHIILDFNLSSLCESELYSISDPKVNKIEGVTFPKLNLLNSNLFVKRLYSTHEIDMYKKLSGTGVSVKMLGYSENGYLVLEKAIPLRNIISKLDKKECINKLIHKVKLMHMNNVIHGDIRLDNLLYKDNNVFICDFEDKGYSEQWAAPEVLTDYKLTKEFDMYSLGCTIYEIVTGNIPWYNDEYFYDKVEEKDFSLLIVEPYEELIKKLLINRKID